MNKTYLWKELRHHLPFSILSVVAGLILLAILTFITEAVGTANTAELMESLFHVFHPSHLLVSALATTAMYWQHEKNFLKALAIGIAGSIGICGISDIFIPYIAGYLLGAEMHLHVCIFEHPQLILPFLLVGVLVGFIAPGTIEKHEGVIFSHSVHIFISAAASIMYLVSFGVTHWIHQVGAVLIYMIIAVVLPCCTSDIIFPLLFVKKK